MRAADHDGSKWKIAFHRLLASRKFCMFGSSDDGWEAIYLREEHCTQLPRKRRLFWVVKKILRLLRVRKVYALLGRICDRVKPLFDHVERKQGILYLKTDDRGKRAAAKAKVLAARARRRHVSK